MFDYVNKRIFTQGLILVVAFVTTVPGLGTD